MKIKTLLIAAVMFFALSVAAFAQATFSVGSIPVTTVVASGLTEKTGDVTFTTIPASPNVLSGTFTISYGVPITFIGAVFEAGATVPSTRVTVLSSTGGNLVLTINTGIAAPFSFRVTGVRVAVANTSLTSLDASISATNNAIVAGQTNPVRVINSISPGISSVTATPPFNTPLTINAVTGLSAPGTANLNVTEGFLNAYGVTNTTDTSQTISTMVKITISQPPPGLSLTFPVTPNTTEAGVPVTNAFQLADAQGNLLTSAAVLTNTSTSFTVYYRVVTDTNPTALDTLAIPITVSQLFTAILPLQNGDITATATLAPIGIIQTPCFAGFVCSAIPRYVEALVGPAVIVRIVPGTTTLLVPYATVGGLYNTGLAIANTTEGPAASATGFAAAVPQSGTMKFFFFPQATGTVVTYVTAAGSPGAGLDANGFLVSGGLYTVLLDQLLTAAKVPGDFSGHIFVVTNFTNAHGQYFISDFEAFTNGALMLVLTGSRSAAAESLGN